MAQEVFDPASAKAIEEAAKLGSRAIGAATSLATYRDRVFDRLPDNLVGLLGDYVEHKRLRRAADLWAGTKEHLRKSGAEPIDVSPSVLLPLIAAAVDEDRPVLKELWEKLLAAAMDQSKADLVRPSLIALLKQMDPLDARVLLQMTAPGPRPPLSADFADFLSECLSVSRDEAYFSLEHLFELGCLDQPPNSTPQPRTSAKARLLMRAVGD